MITEFVVTRPILDAGILIENLQNNGLIVHHVPMMSINFVSITPTYKHIILDLAKQNILGMLFTSANGVRAWVKELSCYSINDQHQIKIQLVCCVGIHTTNLAKNNGFKQCLTADGDVQSILILFDQHKSLHQYQWWYLHGYHYQDKLLNGLRDRKVCVQNICIYKAITKTKWSKDIINALHDAPILAVILYSSRTANLWEIMVRRWGLDFSRMRAFCLSKTIAGTLNKSWKKIDTFSNISSTTVLEILLTECK